MKTYLIRYWEETDNRTWLQKLRRLPIKTRYHSMIVIVDGDLVDVEHHFPVALATAEEVGQEYMGHTWGNHD